MRGKLMFLGGLAAGFVLGTRAGREKYEELKQAALKIKEHPTVQEATGVVQEQANRLLHEGKDKVTDKLGNTKVGEKLLTKSDTTTAYSTDTDYALTTPSTTTTPKTTGTTTTSTTGY